MLFQNPSARANVKPDTPRGAPKGRKDTPRLPSFGENGRAGNAKMRKRGSTARAAPGFTILSQALLAVGVLVTVLCVLRWVLRG